MRRLKLILFFSLISILIFGTTVIAKQYQGEVPNSFDQSPMLEQKVESGELPSAEERIPDEPYVVEPNQTIGEYGGTLNVAGIRPNGWGDDHMIMDTFNGFVKPNPTGDKVVPNFAKKVDISEDMETYTIHLRKGVKWSDGEPFTTEDIMFWYEDSLLNKELTPAISDDYKANGEIMKLEKIDDTTFEVKFSAPKPYFLNNLMFMGWGDILLPKHYLKQFHPNYVDEETLQKKIKDGGFDHWYQLFQYKNQRVAQAPINPELPTLTPYKLVKKTSDRRLYERNPYYWKVDTEGNQLPYIDKMDCKILTDREVFNGQAISGELDFAAFECDIRNYPMYKKYEDQIGFKTMLWEGETGNEVIYMLNLTSKDQVLREIFQDVRFRRALSLAINREEINETIYYGKAEPKQMTVYEESEFFEPEFANAYIDYNPEKAKNLLNEMGLTDNDGDGWREDPDGNKINFTIEYYPSETPKEPNVDLVTSHWQDIGINVDYKQISGELRRQRGPANMMDATVDHGWAGSTLRFTIAPRHLGVPTQPSWDSSVWPAWARWVQSNGEEGEEPPEQIKQIRSWYEEMITSPDEEKRLELGKKILKSQAENLWIIGTIGKAPYPIIINEDLKNFPETGIWSSDLLWSTVRDPEQIFFQK